MTLTDIKLVIEKAQKRLQKVNVNDLVNVLEICDQVYYNNGKGLNPKLVTWVTNNVTDKVYDYLFDYLAEISPKNKYLKKVGAPIKNAQSRKVKLPFHMGSLNKVKPDTSALEKFLEGGGTFVISDKVDGISLGIVPSKGLLVTRGNGSVGQDISHLAKVLKLPKVRNTIEVRAEIVMPSAEFEKYMKDNPDAKNARNTISGLVNKASTDSVFKKAKVLTYQIVGKKPSEAFKQLRTLGYDVPFYKVIKNVTQEQLEQLLVERKKSAPYEIDGLVISRDVVEVPKSGNPKNSVAFKSENVETHKTFKVLDVEWKLSKHGLYKPVVLLEPQELDGVTVARATAHNAKFIVDNKIGKGALVSLRRSGGVIPYINSVEKAARKASLPDTEYLWNNTKVDIFMPNSEKQDSVKIIKLTNLLQALGVERVKQGVVTTLFDNGITTPVRLLNVSKKKLLSMPGIQDKTATSIVSQIQEARAKVEMPSLLFGSGCFPRTMGVKRLEEIYKVLPKFLTDKDTKILSTVEDMKGFNTKTAEDFLQGLTKFKVWYSKIAHLVTIVKPKVIKAKSTSLKGKNFVFSGVRNKDIEQLIIENGGTVSNSINKDTFRLILKDLSSTSSKATKARNLGIKIITMPLLENLLKNTFSIV